MSTGPGTVAERLRNGPALVGMVHLAALPGTPASALSPSEIVADAVRDAETYVDCGVDIVLLENMHDVPYTRGVGPEIVAVMTAAATAVRRRVPYCGIQILAGASREALAVAHAAGLDFVRVEGFVYAHVADEGITESCAGDLLRYRRQIGAEDIQLWTDVKKKHAAHAWTSDVDLDTAVRTARFFRSDGVIVTGVSTGEPVDLDELKSARGATDGLVLVGSGVTPADLPLLAPFTDGFIVGSYVKEEGRWARPLCPRRVAELVAALESVPGRRG